uniref:Uncharacterized protein n=1 Tax=Anguilla anguilla TaxID=7936 RepID=A0A0E9SBU9_ANGAN
MHTQILMFSHHKLLHFIPYSVYIFKEIFKN